MDRKIKVGVIGTGFVGIAHIESLRRLPQIDVTSIAENGRKLAEKKGMDLGIEKVYENYDDIISDNDIDCIHVCTPNFLHYPIVKKIIDAGKNVLCEKPLALNIEEGEELVNLSKEKT